jgi:cyanoexosortase A
LTGNFNHISLELIGWSAVMYCLWQRRDRIVLRQATISQFGGWFLIALMLVRGINIRGSHTILLEFTPLVIGVAIALIAVGLKQFKHYQRELWLMAVIAAPIEFLMQGSEHLINASLLTAKYAHALMWYLGFLVERKGTVLEMPTGAVDIYLGCSGLEAVVVSLKVAVFFLIVFPTHWKEKLFVPAIAVLSAFVINGFRVMFLAYLVSQDNQAAFEYWHGDDGAQIFSMISMTVFSTYCQILIEREKPKIPILAISETPEELERSAR